MAKAKTPCFGFTIPLPCFASILQSLACWESGSHSPFLLVLCGFLAFPLNPIPQGRVIILAGPKFFALPPVVPPVYPPVPAEGSVGEWFPVHGRCITYKAIQLSYPTKLSN